MKEYDIVLREYKANTLNGFRCISIYFDEMFALLKKLSIDFDLLKLCEMVWICDFVFNRCVFIEFIDQLEEDVMYE